MKHHFAWALLALVLACCGLFQAAAEEETAFSVRNGSREEPRIAITIDDCYDAEQIQAALDLCQAYGIHVTFFPIGSAMRNTPSQVWQRMAAEGHEIGNHTWSHKNLTEMNSRQVKYQMLGTQEKLDEMLGYHYPMQVMRAPGGHSSTLVNKAVAAVGYLHTVKWDVSQTDPDKALEQVQNGSILLFHTRAKDIRCLEVLVPQLLEKGYECVTVSQLLNLPEIVPSDEVYHYQRSDAD